MDSKTLQVEILKMLRKSTISDHQKNMVKILLPVMELRSLKNIYNSLKKEKADMEKLDQQEKRVEMEYKGMVDKLCEMEMKKK